LDIGVDSVTQRQDESGKYAVVTLRNVTGVPFPVEMRVKFSSGTTQDLRLPVDIWYKGKTFQAVIPETDAKVTGVRLWPDPSVPDWDASNNTWGDAPAADPLKPVTM
jgi:hypothetical protein